MANRRPQTSGRRMEFGRNDRGKNYNRSGVSPWQGGGPGGTLPNLLPLASGSTEATLALASNIINLLQPRQNAVPSLLDMPIRRDFGPNIRYDRSFGPARMGNQGNFRRTGNYNRAGERINTNRKPFKPNDGQRQQNKSSPKKDADSKTKPVKESDQEEKGENETMGTSQEEGKEEKKESTPKTRYDDINSQLLKCHICNKSMWDGRSFENHLSGRAHAIMMQKTAESYALTADTMRQECKIREMKRTRKTGQQPARDFYCAMCDMYAADGAVHRTTVGHRKLKKYLHPTCASCHKEMPTRIELDEHRLTAEHLRNIQDKQEITNKPKPEVMIISTLDMEQFYLRDDKPRRRRPNQNEQQAASEEADKDGENAKKDQEEGGEEKEKLEGEEKTESGEEKKQDKGPDTETTILDYKEGDDLSNVTSDMFPAYSTTRGVGASFLGEFRCVECKLCHKLLDNDETAQVHLRTWRHQQLFKRLLLEKTGYNLLQQAQETKEKSLKRSTEPDDDSGNWKRRKTVPEDSEQLDQSEDVNGLENEDIEMKEDPKEKGDEDNDYNTGEDLEDWEQTVDEILEDEKINQEDKSAETPAEEPPKEEEKKEEIKEKVDDKPEEQPQEEKKEEVKESTPTLTTPVGRGSPRGRSRGRARGRGRY